MHCLKVVPKKTKGGRGGVMSNPITLMVTLTSVDITKFHDYSLNQEKVPGTKQTLSSVCTSCDCVNPQTKIVRNLHHINLE